MFIINIDEGRATVVLSPVGLRRSKIMTKMLFALALLIAASTVVLAQEKLTLVPGTYRGHIDARNGDDAFELTIKTVSDGKLSGISLFHKGPKNCRVPFSMSGTVTAEGSVQIDASKGVLSGCERTYDLKVTSATELNGTLVGPKGIWKVKLVKQ